MILEQKINIEESVVQKSINKNLDLDDIIEAISEDVFSDIEWDYSIDIDDFNGAEDFKFEVKEMIEQTLYDKLYSRIMCNRK